MVVITIRDIAIAFGYDVDKASEKKVNDSIQSLKNTATKVLGAIGIVFSIRGIASLAEAAADAQALESQFSQVFGEIEDQAESSLQKLADDTGVAAGRMKGSFTQMASFAKTTGMDTADAMNLSERAMLAVADSAAFYDKSIEEVTSSLQSFLKGNFANDAALGLSATETTRNAAANALYGKSFKQLSESQKQLTLLKMVEDANELSGALGQAARESDTWTNQLGNLKQSMTDLKAAAGKSFLNPAIQVLKLCSQLVAVLTDGIKELTGEGRFLNRVFERITTGIKRAQDAVSRFVSRVGGAANAVKLLTVVAGSFMTVFAAQKIMATVKAIRNMDKALLKVKLKMLAAVAVIAILALLVEDFIGFMNGSDSLMGELFKKFGVDGDKVRETIRGILDGAKALLPYILDLAKNVGGMLAGAFKALLPFVADFAESFLPPLIEFLSVIIPLIVDFGKQLGGILLDAAKQILPLLKELGASLMEMGKALLPTIVGVIKKLLPVILQIAQKVLPVFLSLTGALLPLLFQIIDTVLPVIISLIEAILPLVLEIIDAVLPVIISLLETVLPILMDIISAVLPVILDLISALLPLVFEIVEAVLPVILELITAILPILTPIIELVANLVKTLLPPLLSLLESVLPILKPILSILKPIADVLGTIIGAVSKMTGGIADGISWIVDKVTGGTSGAPSSGGVPAFASGTNSTPDSFIAGDGKGPELVTGAKGRKVFTHAQTGNIFQTLKDIAMLGLAPKPETVAATSSSVENKSIVQNVDITNQFNGDRAGQKKSAEAMGKAADDATGIMARGLAYVR